MRIYIVRHGEAGDDLDDSYGGAADFRLTDRGREQARRAGSELKPANVEAIYASPLSRAKETAAIIQDEVGLQEYLVVEDLRERNSYGVLSGHTKARAAQLFGYILDNLKEKPGYSREPLLGAEDFDEFLRRVDRVFGLVTANALSAGHRTIAIVTHGKFTRALFEHTLQVSEQIDLELSAIMAIDHEPAMTTVVAGQPRGA